MSLIRYFKLKEGVVLPKPVLACRLLKSANLSDVHFQLALSTTGEMTFENMRKTLKRLFSDGGIGCAPKSDCSGEVSQAAAIKVEPVMLSEGYRQRPGSRSFDGYHGLPGSSRGFQRGGKRNSIGKDGRVMRCFNCKSEYHFLDHALSHLTDMHCIPTILMRKRMFR